MKKKATEKKKSTVMTIPEYIKNLAVFFRVTNDNEMCVVLNADHDSKLEDALINAGCFDGDEIRFRIRKKNTVSYTTSVWHKNGTVNHYEWDLAGTVDAKDFIGNDHYDVSLRNHPYATKREEQIVATVYNLLTAGLGYDFKLD